MGPSADAMRGTGGPAAALVVSVCGAVAASATEGDEKAAANGVWRLLIVSDGVTDWCVCGRVCGDERKPPRGCVCPGSYIIDRELLPAIYECVWLGVGATPPARSSAGAA